MTKAQKVANKALAIANLRPYLTPGTIVYTTVTHVARSGMSRTIRLFLVRGNAIGDITGHVANIIGARLTDRGLVRAGCGMNMCADTVMNLAYAMFPTGFECIV